MPLNSSVDCDLELKSNEWVCSRCRRPLRAIGNTPPRRGCTYRGLGDKFTHWLSCVGITKDRYAAARGRRRVVGGMNCVFVEMSPDEISACGCADRQELLNRVGVYVSQLFS